jgi:hypothetical protein
MTPSLGTWNVVTNLRALFAVALFAGSVVSPAQAASNQPYICAAGYFPQGQQYWYACNFGSATPADAMACSINGWQWNVLFLFGPDYANWSYASGKSTKPKQDMTGYYYKMRGKPCKPNPLYRPPTHP